jgi:hypothetical protein
VIHGAIEGSRAHPFIGAATAMRALNAYTFSFGQPSHLFNIKLLPANEDCNQKLPVRMLLCSG